MLSALSGWSGRAAPINVGVGHPVTKYSTTTKFIMQEKGFTIDQRIQLINTIAATTILRKNVAIPETHWLFSPLNLYQYDRSICWVLLLVCSRSEQHTNKGPCPGEQEVNNAELYAANIAMRCAHRDGDIELITDSLNTKTFLFPETSGGSYEKKIEESLSNRLKQAYDY
ncbi:hypothetical protein PROFUN_16025 [Planoprotostelium fungivorum]|uniref:Uncharacterized protein n=1 Tax=Planoprotostelium fungivorum TaxID=1890364 RepID=A0A2P6MTD4_9EUKA|nr:hypothetical protein PROFUN_16025 [Planoprotostelium fungivorum]